MNLAYNLCSRPLFEAKPTTISRINHTRLKICCAAHKKCLRCNTLYEDTNNSPIACSFHGHTTGMCVLCSCYDVELFRLIMRFKVLLHLYLFIVYKVLHFIILYFSFRELYGSARFLRISLMGFSFF